jgi:serine/threonine protein kinase
LTISRVVTGSFTQWVFKPKTCQCQQPGATSRAQDAAQTEIDHTFSKAETDRGDSAPASMDAEKFPIERYRPIRALGDGGVGTVQLCFDTKLNKEVAVKVLRVATPDQLVSFQAEARVTAKLRHPDIVSILDFGSTKHGAPYMVLESVEGVALSRVIMERGPLDESAAVSIAIRLAAALEHAHAVGIFHRDVSASNVLIHEKAPGEWDVHVIDFGIAFLESAQTNLVDQGKTLVGTPRYMSPDQFLGRRFDARSEVYSVGCLLYEMVSGVVPFFNRDPLALLQMHAYDPVVPISEVRKDHNVSVFLEQVIFKCLEKEPEKRFQNMQDLRAALSQCIVDSAVFQSPTASYVVAGDEPANSVKKLMIAGFVVCLFLLGGLGVAMFSSNTREPLTAPMRVRFDHATLLRASSLQDVNPLFGDKASDTHTDKFDKPGGVKGTDRAVHSQKLTEFAMPFADIPDVLSKQARNRVTRNRADPVFREILKDPAFDKAYTPERLAKFLESDLDAIWRSNPNFSAVSPLLIRLWGDAGMLKVFNDPVVHQFFSNPQEWLPKAGSSFKCPSNYSSNKHVRTLVADKRFKSLIQSPDFHKVITEQRLQNCIKDPDKWRMLLLYFIEMNNVDRARINKGSRGRLRL